MTDIITSTRRYLLKAKRTPEVVLFSTIQPVMFVLLFVYVLGSVIDLDGVDYRQYLLAGVFCQVTVFGSALTGIGLADDLQSGMSERFRTLPMSRAAVIIGRTTTDLLNNMLVVAVMIMVGLIVGWRTHTPPSHVAGGIAVLMLFSYAMSWVSATIGLSVRSVEVAQSAGVIWLYPLTFISNVFVPLDGLPPALKHFAEWNPVSVVTQCERELFGNLPAASPMAWPLQHAVPSAVTYSLVILAVFCPWAVYLHRKP